MWAIRWLILDRTWNLKLEIVLLVQKKNEITWNVSKRGKLSKFVKYVLAEVVIRPEMLRTLVVDEPEMSCLQTNQLRSRQTVCVQCIILHDINKYNFLFTSQRRWLNYRYNACSHFGGHIGFHLEGVLRKWQIYFYRAMLCIRGTSHGPVSVSPSFSVRQSVCHKSEFY